MDHRGTAHVLLDETGMEIGRRWYDAFGVLLGSTGSWPVDLGYQTNWMTVKIGGVLYCISKYRIYAPNIGIFLSRDFLPFLNKYRCFSNNPVGQVDRDGLADAQPEKPKDPDKPEDAKDISVPNQPFTGGTTSGDLKKGAGSVEYGLMAGITGFPLPAPGTGVPTGLTPDQYQGGVNQGKIPPVTRVASVQADLKLTVTLNNAKEYTCYYFNQKVKLTSTPPDTKNDNNDYVDDVAYYYPGQSWVNGVLTLTDKPGPARQEIADVVPAGGQAVAPRPTNAQLDALKQGLMTQMQTFERYYSFKTTLRKKEPTAKPDPKDPIVGTWEWEVKFKIVVNKDKKDPDIFVIPKKLEWKP